MIKEIGSSKILPPSGFQFLIDKWENIFLSELICGLNNKVLGISTWNDQTKYQNDSQGKDCF